MNEIKKISLLIIILIIVLMLGCNVRAAVEEVTFEDENMYQAVCKELTRRHINYTDLGNKTIEVDINEVTGLWIYDSNINSLKGIEKFTELYSIDIHNNKISDLMPLANLTKIDHINADSNNISDMSPLANLNRLDNLHINSNNISDISVLSNLTNLKTLWISTNKITDIDPIKKLTKLENLYIYNNEITDITPLKDLTSLKSLSLESNKITDISSVKNLKNLNNLNVAKNKITDISSIKDLTELQWLYLAENNISDISALEGLTKLKNVWLVKNKIVDISPLKNKDKIELLYLSENKIKDISPLQGLDSLIYLTLDKNEIEDVTFLKDLKSVGIIHLEENNIKDVSALGNLYLQELYLNKNHISDISALKNFDNKYSLVFLYDNTLKENIDINKSEVKLPEILREIKNNESVVYTDTELKITITGEVSAKCDDGENLILSNAKVGDTIKVEIQDGFAKGTDILYTIVGEISVKENDNIQEKDENNKSIEKGSNETTVDDEKFVYKMLEEAKESHVVGSEKNLIMKSDGDLSKLVELRVDNNKISADNYLLESGSTIATLKAEYLDTLSVGKHTLTFVYNDGEVSTNFIIAKNDEKGNVAVQGSAQEKVTNQVEVKKSKNPPTGDNIIVYFIVLFMSTISLIIIVKKYRVNEN